MMEEYELILKNPRERIFFAVIYAYQIMGKPQFTLSVKFNVGGRIRRLSEPYRTERGAKIAYSRKFQPLDQYEQPKWETVNE